MKKALPPISVFLCGFGLGRGGMSKVELTIEHYKCPSCKDVQIINTALFYNGQTYCHKCKMGRILIERHQYFEGHVDSDFVNILKPFVK